MSPVEIEFWKRTAREDLDYHPRRLDPDQIEMDVAIPGRGVLVLSDVWVLGWTASVNGPRKRVIPVDVAFRGVEVVPGRSRVVFTYRRTHTYAGFALAFVGLSVVGLLFVGSRRRRPVAG